MYIVVLAVLLLLLFLTPTTYQTGGMPPFSDINKSTMYGVPSSIDQQLNLPTDRKPWPIRTGSEFGQPNHTYYGHGIPLQHEDIQPGKIWNPLLTYHNLNLKCSPDCCPSPYSCDKGCVCTTLQDLNY